MSIYVNGVNMPKNDETLILKIDSSGNVEKIVTKKIAKAKASTVGYAKPNAVQRDEHGAIITEVL